MTTRDDQLSRPPSGEPAPARHGGLVLLAVALGTMVVQLDGTVVSIANPSIASGLHASLSSIAWVATSYLLVIAALLIPAGAVADRIGHSRAFLIGIAGFSLGSVVCGLSTSIGMLIGARVLVGVFAALLTPAGLAVLRSSIAPDKLGRAFGVYGGISALSLAGGPVLGGLIVQYASWPWVFFINLPVGIVAVAVGLLVIPRKTEHRPAPLDVVGAITLTLAMTAIVWAINGVPVWGWTSVNTLGVLIVGLVLAGVFVVLQKRVRHPMVPLSLFRNRTFSAGSVLMLVSRLAFYAIVFYLTFYLQGVRGDDPVGAAVALLPLTAVFAVSAPLASLLMAKLGMRWTLVIGAVLTAVALLALLRLGVDSSGTTLALPLVLCGFGIGFFMVPAMQAIVGSAPVDKAGAASGVQQSAAQIGSTLGVAVFGSVISTFVATNFGGAVQAAFGGSPSPLALQFAADPTVRQAVGLGFSPATSQQLSQHLIQANVPADQVNYLTTTLTTAAHSTFVDGMHLVFLISAGITVVSGLIALIIREPKGAEETG
ncbi:MFS transporter [Kutzneria sp. 744]|uniref:MFS transporter n=1 Tax=Kutzneria sp. (strain 744) TaxID=345341 RepID=UPI0003EEBD37|nr:MFS transporter [Kutzneria sp. 744]EWM18590.1 tetracenomycin C resistance and export protein [Kutzneria sp. 744]